MNWIALGTWSGFGVLCWGASFWLSWKYKDPSFGGIIALPAWIVCGPLMLVFVFGFAVGAETERRKKVDG